MVFLDIETTSLSPRAGGVTLVGLTYVVLGGRVVEQHFVDHPRDEGRVLREAARRVAQFSTVVTYHGLGFDIPFLQARVERHGSYWPERQHWDLLPDARRWRRTHRAPENCRLQTVHEHFALDRVAAGRRSSLCWRTERGARVPPATTCVATTCYLCRIPSRRAEGPGPLKPGQPTSPGKVATPDAAPPHAMR